MQKFLDFEKLEAREEKVLKAWEGLGYYSGLATCTNYQK